jgi:hypothetical protein
LKAVLEESEVFALATEVFDEFVEFAARRVVEAFELDFPVSFRAKNARPHRFDLSAADADFVRAIHQLADELEFETRFAERIDPAIRFVENAGRFERVLDVVGRMHGRAKVPQAGDFAKKRADTTGESALWKRIRRTDQPCWAFT